MTLRDHFIKLFSKDCVNKILEPDVLRIRKDIDLDQYFSDYSRVIRLNQGNFKINGCTDCLEKGIAVRQQDFPGWVGELKNKDFLILGLEISPKEKLDIHIAYNLGKARNKRDERLYEMFGLIFKDLENRIYITDLAKCYSTDVNVSRINCLKYFKDELKLVRNLNPNIKIIIQGYQTQEKISNHLQNLHIDETFELHPLIRRGTFKSEGYQYSVLVFPHTSRSRGAVEKWIEIQQDVKNIKKVLRE